MMIWAVADYPQQSRLEHCFNMGMFMIQPSSSEFELLTLQIQLSTQHLGISGSHCAILIPRKPDIRDCRFFDFEHNEETVHPNIRIPSTVYHWKNIVNYIDKQDDAIYGEIEVKKSQEEKLKNCIEWVNSCKTWAKVFHCPDMEVMNTLSGKLEFFKNMHKYRAEHRVEKAKYTVSTRHAPTQKTRPPSTLQRNGWNRGSSMQCMRTDGGDSHDQRNEPGHLAGQCKQNSGYSHKINV